MSLRRSPLQRCSLAEAMAGDDHRVEIVPVNSVKYMSFNGELRSFQSYATLGAQVHTPSWIIVVICVTGALLGTISLESLMESTSHPVFAEMNRLFAAHEREFVGDQKAYTISILFQNDRELALDKISMFRDRLSNVRLPQVGTFVADQPLLDQDDYWRLDGTVRVAKHPGGRPYIFITDDDITPEIASIPNRPTSETEVPFGPTPRNEAL